MEDLQSAAVLAAPEPESPRLRERTKPSRIQSLLGKLSLRRHYLVNYRRQIRAALLVSFVVLIPTMLLNVNLHLSAAAQTQALFADTPDAVRQQISEHDRTEILLVLIGSLVYVGGVFLLTVLETHQTSGAAMGISRHFRNIRDGRYDAKLHLRGSDNLRELVKPFNEMTQALTGRAIRSAAILNDLAGEADELDGGGSLARQLRELAVSQAHLAGKSR